MCSVSEKDAFICRGTTVKPTADFSRQSPEDSGIVFSKLRQTISSLEFYAQLNRKFGDKTGDKIFRAM